MSGFVSVTLNVTVNGFALYFAEIATSVIEVQTFPSEMFATSSIKIPLTFKTITFEAVPNPVRS